MHRASRATPRVTGIVGDMGAGKTLLMSAMAEKLKDSYVILANYALGCRKYDVTPENMPGVLKGLDHVPGKKLLCLDELHLFSDARQSMSYQNQLMSYLITQSRKRDLYVLWSTQRWHQVEVRVRANTDLVIVPDYYPERDILLAKYYIQDAHGKFVFSHKKTFGGLHGMFERYDTTQLMGDCMIERMAKAQARRLK